MSGGRVPGEAAPASLIELASDYYRAAGRFAWHFARGKLACDPMFAAILAQGLLSGRARILDLGCGQGLLAAWLLAAQVSEQRGWWPQGWPPAPQPRSLVGVEILPREVERAHLALGTRVRIVHADFRAVDYGPADAIVMLDVLHYNDFASQEAVLARARAALAPGGVLLLRVGDAAGGVRFGLGLLLDWTVALARRHRPVRFCCRPLAEWLELLGRLGFVTRAVPMSAGTPFANFLLIGAPA
ncbi:MAG TPA: methyltransferase domain-containing protein [Steroidobacteraceae bacterium]|nr:methyltransferase domain-containing protein [Steroidobacteraceae bacterium]